MRYFRLFILFFVLLTGFGFSCKKWKDPAPVDDPRLTNPYCNDPEAVNYNWGFPGKPDNTVCYYAADLFAGRYRFYDTAYLSSSEFYVLADSFDIEISRISNSKITLSGICGSGSLMMTAGEAYTATIDTTVVVDSFSVNQGQLFCRPVDTVVGTFTRDKVDSSLIYVEFTVRSDTGVTVHTGRARKK